MEKWIIAHFSPTGGTKKVADAITAGFNMPVAEMDLIKENSAITLGELAEGKGEPAEQAVEAIPETLLVFCGLSQALMTQVLEVIRVAKIPPIQLKAMLTDTNKDWDTLQLVEELRQEKAELEKGQN